MTIRDIVEKLMREHGNAPRTQEELQRARDRRILARMNMGKPTGRYAAFEDRNMSIANYKHGYAPMELKKLNMRLGRQADEDYRQ